ncbi:class I adenylate-forming enzyme family protein [Enterovirga sp. CN4-39]|uniref:class I adenylate-forming enzyme family protein n=1 Tax=Enterovirga sp. CN4-39 TaxID=3400910 RepID=UPI003C0CC2A2
MILGRSLARNARLFADRPAILDETGSAITHAAFADRVWRLADSLQTLGLRKGDRVAVLARNSPDYLVAHYALGAAGIWMVPINTALKAHDVEYRLAHAEVQGLFVSSEHILTIADLTAETTARLQGRVILMDGVAPGLHSLEELVDAGGATPPDVSISPEDTLYIGYTSGTTGTPKGALVSHRAIVCGFLYKALAYGLTSADVTLNPGPYWHSAPRDFAALAIYLGGTSIVPVRFDAAGYLQLVERHGVTNSFLVPTMIQRLTASDELRVRDLTSLRHVISGGAPLPSAVKERFLAACGDVLTEFYGATETRIVTTISARELGQRERSVGRPVHDVELQVLAASGAPVPAGDVGEVYIRGPGLFSGYWREPERTAAAHRGEWFSLGDMGRLDADGYLYLVDRKQDMIISGGENIFPNDIEECLERHASVREAAVVGAPDDQWGEVIVAYVVPAVVDPDPEELTMFCVERLPNYMKPRRFVFCETLPRNPTGKLLRRELRERERACA